MLKLIKIETFKLFKRTKTWVILIAFALLTALIAYAGYRDAANMKKYYGTEAELNDRKDYLESLKRDKENIPEEIKADEDAVNEYKKMIDQNIEDAEKDIAKYESLLEKEKAGDWKAVVNAKIEELEEQIELSKDDSYSKEWVAELQRQIEALQYYIDNDIKPEQSYDYNARIFLTIIISVLGEIFLAMGIAVFASDMVSGESTPPTLKLLLTQPVSRGKVLLSKFISVTLSAVTLIIGVELIAYLIVGLIFGFGDPNYPLAVGLKYVFESGQEGMPYLVPVAGSSYYIPAWEYIIKLLLLQALFIATCTAVVFLLSTLVKTSMVSMGISVVSIIASFVLFLGFGVLRSMHKFIFILFGNVEALLTGQVAVNLNNPNVNMNTAIIMFIVWIVVSYVIAHINFTKKDILI